MGRGRKAPRNNIRNINLVKSSYIIGEKPSKYEWTFQSHSDPGRMGFFGK
jgi:hypothetical protein